MAIRLTGPVPSPTQLHQDVGELRGQVSLLEEVIDQPHDWGTDYPNTPTVGTRRFSQEGGYDKYLSAADGNLYSCGQLTLFVPSPQTTTAVTPTLTNVTGLSCALASGQTYRLRSIMRLSQNSGGTQAMRGGFTGPAVSMCFLWGYSVPEGGGGGTPNTGFSSDTPISATFGTVAANYVYEVVVDGIFTTSASGTLHMVFTNATAGSCNINTGSFMDVRPV